MTWWLRAFVVFVEALSSVASAHMVAHNICYSSSRDPTPDLLCTRHEHSTHTYMLARPSST